MNHPILSRRVHVGVSDSGHRVVDRVNEWRACPYNRYRAKAWPHSLASRLWKAYGNKKAK